MRLRWWTLYVILGLGDVVALIVAAGIADQLRGGLRQSASEPSELVAGAALIPFLLFLFWCNRLYTEEKLLSGTQEYVGALRACTLGPLTIVGVEFLIGDSTVVPRMWVIFFWLFGCLLVFLWRFSGRRLIRFLRSRGRLSVRLLVVGASDQGVAIAEQLDSPNRQGSEVVGFLDDFLPEGTAVVTTDANGGHTLRVLGDPSCLRRVAQEEHVDEVIIVPPALCWESLSTIIGGVASISSPYRIRLAPGMYDVVGTGVRAGSRGGVPLLTINKAYITGGDRILKGLLDRALAGGVLATFAPVLGALAIYGRLAGREPVFERRLICGLSAQPFDVWFFGTWLVRHRLLRGLPSLLSVLSGRVSLVGPRPQPIPNGGPLPKMQRMKPGLTGPWRIASRWTAQSPWNSDLWYARNYSIWEDLRILFQTVLLLKAEAGAEDVRLARWQPEIATALRREDAWAEKSLVH